MPERRTKGGYESADIPASAMPFPDAFTRPAMGTRAPGPQDAAPRVPNLACPKCGEPDTGMRWCNGTYSLTFGMCLDDKRGEHFHRDCSRCKHRWVTRDVLGQQ